MYLIWLWDQCTMEFMQRKNTWNQSQVSRHCVLCSKGWHLTSYSISLSVPGMNGYQSFCQKGQNGKRNTPHYFISKKLGEASVWPIGKISCATNFFYVLSLWSEPVCVTHPNSHTSPIIVNKMENLRRTVNMGRLKNKQNIA